MKSGADGKKDFVRRACCGMVFSSVYFLTLFCMSETANGPDQKEGLEFFQIITMGQLYGKLQLNLDEDLLVQRRRGEAEIAFYGKIIERDPQHWADIFLKGKAPDEITPREAEIIFGKVRALFRDYILGAGNRFLPVSKEQVGMLLSELAATDPVVQAGWMQPADQNPDAKAGYGIDGKPLENGCWADAEPLIRTSEALRLLREWTDRFGEPPAHEFGRKISDRGLREVQQAVDKVLGPVGTAETGD